MTFDNNKSSKKGDKAISQAQMERVGLAKFYQTNFTETHSMTNQSQESHMALKVQDLYS